MGSHPFHVAVRVLNVDDTLARIGRRHSSYRSPSPAVREPETCILHGGIALISPIRISRWREVAGMAFWGLIMSKAGKRRFCPAVQREISPAECGDNRGSRYACPAECAFNPFAPANYTDFLELEKNVDGKATEWLARDRPELEREIQRAVSARSPHALHATLVWHMHFAQDTQRQTCAQR